MSTCKLKSLNANQQEIFYVALGRIDDQKHDYLEKYQDVSDYSRYRNLWCDSQLNS